MSHMVAASRYGEWVEIDGPNGGEWLPADLSPGGRDAILADDFHGAWDAYQMYSENLECWAISLVRGLGIHETAPGYLDQTPWRVLSPKLIHQCAPPKRRRRGGRRAGTAEG